MTKEAAKNNRVQAPSSASSSNRTTLSSVSPVKPPSVTKKTKKSKWWCFGGGAVDSDNEEVLDEKRPYSNSKRRSVSSLSAIDVDEADENEEEWNEARAASGTGLLGFSCSKSSNRQRATLKKKTY